MSSPREERLRSAERLVSRGRIDAAIAEYEKLLADRPNDTGLSNLIGDLHARERRHGDAIVHYQRAATVFAHEGFYVKAIALYKKIHRLDPTRLDVHEKLADLYGRQGLLKEAVSQYQALADYYTQNNSGTEAVSVYRRLAELEPRELSHHARLAELYQEQKRFDLVGHEYCEIAGQMLRGGRVDEALKILHHGLDLNPANPSFIRDSVALLQAADRADLATQFVELAETQNPGLADIGNDPQSAAAPTTKPATTKPATTKPATTKPATGTPAEPSEPGRKVPNELDRPPKPASPSRARAPAASSGGSSKRRLGPPPTPGETEELLAEAEVFVKYGLQEKALDRLHEVLQVSPENLSAYNQLISLLLEQESFAEVVARATAMEAVASELSDPRLWNETRERLETAGFTFEGAQIVASPPESSTTKVTGESKAVQTTPESPPVLDPDPASILEDVGSPVSVDLEKSQVLMEVPTPYLESESSSPDAGVSDLESLLDTDSLSTPEREGESPHEVPEVPSGTHADSDPQKAEKNEFLDMASDLLGELEGDQPLPVEPEPARAAEQSLSEIVNELREAVSETLSAEDSETRYNLAIAYREMGLLDEAIGEFQTVARNPVYLTDCCSLLGQCLRERGLIEQAVKWLRRGLETPNLSEERGLSFLYEIAECQSEQGDRESARGTFAEIYGINSSYRDVVARLTEFSRS